MAYDSLRDWIARLEESNQLKRITAKVDWNLELEAIERRVANQQGPALLFENIKDYENASCRKLFVNSLGTRERVAMALNLPGETSYRGIVEFLKERLGQFVTPVTVASGPVKENIVTGDAVNLYEFPVPKWHELDGGRYIITRGCVVTMDPDTKVMNVGIYRGMIGDDEKSIPVLLTRSQHWGIHFSKYVQRGEEMPVAIVYGCGPALQMCASTHIHHPGFSEYDVIGSIQGEAIQLVKCETSDLYVPASAEIVIEGRISPDPKTYQMEGPFGEQPGCYSGTRQLRPTIRVECITYRNAPIFHGGTAGNDQHGFIEQNSWLTPLTSATYWKALEDIGVPNITGVWGDLICDATNLRISIDKIYREHANQVAAAFWGLARQGGKNLIIVDKDIDVFDDDAVNWALAYRTNAEMGDFHFFRTIGSPLDPSVPPEQKDVMKYGSSKWTRVFIDATVNWDMEPREEWDGERQPPSCTKPPADVANLVNRRWQEYGF